MELEDEQAHSKAFEEKMEVGYDENFPDQEPFRFKVKIPDFFPKFLESYVPYEPAHLIEIKNYFDELNQTLCMNTRGTTLPNFYSIDKLAISLNGLQADRYLEKDFLYFSSQYRLEKYKELLRTLDKFPRVKVVGLGASGKSHFLSDFVLRTRIEKTPKLLRIIYINSSRLFIEDPFYYLENELKYMVACDGEVKDIQEQIFKVCQDKTMESVFLILKWLKNYYNQFEIKVVLVWDQVNVMFSDDVQKNPSVLSIFQELIKSRLYFDYHIFSASNNCNPINILSKCREINMNPFQVFQAYELLQILKEEAKEFKPNDVPDTPIAIKKYSKALCKILWSSITEYCFFKKTFWNKKKNTTFIGTYTKGDAFQEYSKKRRLSILACEEKFRLEYTPLQAEKQEYTETLSKLVYDYEIKGISPKEQITFKSEPDIYNRVLFFYDQDRNFLICTTPLIKKTVLSFEIETNPDIFQNPEYLTDGWKFQLLVQTVFLKTHQKTGLNFGNSLFVQNYQSIYVWDCTDALNFMKAHQGSYMFHFEQQNHFAFDSMLYDSTEKLLVLIQITINRNHDIYYEKLISYINQEEPVRKFSKKGEKEEKIEEEKKHSEKMGEEPLKEEKKNKYQVFFCQLNKDLVMNFVYQWMTKEIFQEIEYRTKFNDITLKDGRHFKIFCQHKQLLEKLKSGK